MSSIFRDLAIGTKKIAAIFGGIGVIVFGVWLSNTIQEVIKNPDNATKVIPEIIEKGVWVILDDKIVALLVILAVAGLFFIAKVLRKVGL